MRAARPALVALIGVAAVLIGGAAVLFAATPALAATGAKLRLSASNGAAGESVTATFSYPVSWGFLGPSCDGPVTFQWDGRSIAQARPERGSGSCFASVTITPPSSASGSHIVKGSAPDVGSAEATYTIDPVPAPPASRPPPPSTSDTPGPVRIASAAQSAQPSREARSASASARPTPSAGSPSPSAAAGPWGSAAPGDPSTLVAMDAPAVIVRPAVSTPLGVWVLMAGGALILLGAALVGAGRLFRRKKRVAFSL